MAVDNQRGFNIGVFKAEINAKKILRPNLFHVEFSMPIGLLSNDAEKQTQTLDTVKTLEYWCESTVLSGLTIQTYSAQRFGYGSLEKRPILPAYGEVQLDFIFDSETTNYDFFHDWINLSINTDMSKGPNEATKSINGGTIKAMPFELAYKEMYETDISFYLYDSEGFVKKKLVLREAFPVSIGDIRLAWADNNSYMRLPIQIAYTDWYIDKV